MSDISSLRFSSLEKVKNNFHNLFVDCSYEEGQKKWDEIVPSCDGSIASQYKYWWFVKKVRNDNEMYSMVKDLLKEPKKKRSNKKKKKKQEDWFLKRFKKVNK